MKKLFNDNAKTIAIVALVGCAVMAYMIYKHNKEFHGGSRRLNDYSDGKIKVEKAQSETTETAETTNE